MNSWNGIGRLGRDPEIRYNQSGFAVGHFSIAIDRPPKKDGTKETDWIPIVVFGQQAENAEKYLRKGMQVGISGRLQVSSYETKDGQKRNRAEIIADRIDYPDKAQRQEPADEWQDLEAFTF